VKIKQRLTEVALALSNLAYNRKQYVLVSFQFNLIWCLTWVPEVAKALLELFCLLQLNTVDCNGRDGTCH